MSNGQVGGVYQQIIQDVIDASRVDFEEGGIDEGVLDELKTGWQRKLTQQQLANFPWDPKPDPPPPAQAPAASAPQPAAATTVPSAPPGAASNGAAYEQQQQQQQPQQPAPAAQGLSLPMPGAPANAPVKPEPNVKTEPGLEANAQLPQGGGQGPEAVQQRVIQQLHAQYGDRATGSINKLMGQQPPANGAAAPQGYPGQYRQNPPGSAGQPQAQGGANGQQPPPSQMDGAADETEGTVGILVQQHNTGEQVELGRVEIDQMLHSRIEARAKAMEGGGLMVPLKRARKNHAAASHRNSAPGAGPARFDGPDDDDEEDEDAINSDLDDSDDPVDDEEDEDDGSQIMLCMYDKVQRVKNKWKCVLKDGVLSVNGKDYVFHKATGEYEW